MDNGTERWRRRTWLAHLCGGVLLIAAGLACLPLFAEGLFDKYRARAWSQARAHVNSARLTTTSWRAELVFGRVVELSFSYHPPTGGQFYADQQVSESFAERLGAAPSGRLIRRHVADARAVPCWYDPAEPSRAVLERDLARNDLAIVIPLGFAAGGVGVIVRGRRLVRAVAGDPFEALRRRNAEGWEVTALPEGGARCALKSPSDRTSLAAITSAVSPHPLQAIDVLDLPLRYGGACRFRVLPREPGGGAGVTVDLRVGTPPRGLFRPGRTVWSERVADPSAGGQGEVISVNLPEPGGAPGDRDEWWLHVVPEAGVAVHPPAYLLLPVESPAGHTR